MKMDVVPSRVSDVDFASAARVPGLGVGVGCGGSAARATGFHAMTMTAQITMD
jgi:hypothetical protein